MSILFTIPFFNLIANHEMNSWGWIIPRAEHLWSRSDMSITNPRDSQGFHFQTNTTSIIHNQEQFAIESPIRTAVAVIASVNAFVALATVGGIVWDSYRNRGIGKKRSLYLVFAEDTKSYPFILSCGIIVQGTFFAIAQSRGLQSLMILDCSSISQLMLAALFIPSHIQLVFSLHATVRALYRRPFSTRGKWKITICLVAIGVLLLGTLLIGLLVRPSSFCFASLLWFLQPYSLGCGTLLAIISSMLLITGTIISLRLRTSPNIDISERTAASHLVYYLLAGLVSNAFVVPFFIDLSVNNLVASSPQTLVLSSLAAIILNLSGVINGSLFLLLRSNYLPTIGPKIAKNSDADDKKQRARAMTPSDCDFGFQITRPISPPRSLHRSDSVGSLIGNNKDEEAALSGANGFPMRHGSQKQRFNIITRSKNMSQLSDSARMSPSLQPKALFFNNTEHGTHVKQAAVPEAPILIPDDTQTSTAKLNDLEAPLSAGLLVPPTIYGMHHRRDSSIGSSATVQIGLRLSNVDDLPLHSSAYLRDSTQSHDLGCPSQALIRGPRRPSPLTTSTTDIVATDLESTSLQKAGLTLHPDVYVPRKNPHLNSSTQREDGFDMSTSRLDSPRSQRSPILPHDGPEVKSQDWI